MAERRRYSLNNQLDIGQILLEAQNRWLRPAEICEILRNYRQFHIAPEPPNKPPNGSLFLFDRKVLRYFRKDGHNWRKKKDGKTVKEAHERLKSGSIDVLHCYYAHGEENENFQRRSYWMLEEDLMHIVLVHYREVKGNKAGFARTRDTEEVTSSQIGSPLSSSFGTSHDQVPSQTTDTTSLSTAQTPEYEDAESVDNYQASSRYHSFLEFAELQLSEDRDAINTLDPGVSNSCVPVAGPNGYCGRQSTVPGMDFISFTRENRGRDNNDAGLGLTCWEDVLEHCTTGFQEAPFRPSVSSTQLAAATIHPKQENVILRHLLTDELSIKQDAVNYPQWQEKLQDYHSRIESMTMHIGLGSHHFTLIRFSDIKQSAKALSLSKVASEDDSSQLYKLSMDQNLHSGSAYDMSNGPDPSCSHPEQQNGHPVQSDLQMLRCLLTPNPENEPTLNNNSSTAKQLLDRSQKEEGLKKLDSFTRWMSKELGEVDESGVQPSPGVYWNTDESGNVIDEASMSSQVDSESYLLGPSLSQHQLFSIIDFSPNWTYTGSETKVLVTGTFLESRQDAEKCRWSCMFGELEVPAEIIADGVLRCHAPVRAAGRVPFYVTCSNRLACSEVREFEYRVSYTNLDMVDACSDNTSEMILNIRLGKLLNLESVSQLNSSSASVSEKPHVSNKISSLMKEGDDEWYHLVRLTSEEEFSLGTVKEQLLQKILKEKLHEWLLQKIIEDGKGPNVLDDGGQGVLHLAAALGYDWAIAPIIAAGVSINFRDVNGWTALHWAAFYGRERTVVALVSMGAASGALTDPTPKFPSGRTPADLASGNGYKGIAGYLAESSLTSHLSSITLQEGDVPEISGQKAIQTVSERSATPVCDGDVPEGLSLKDSLTAVCNAAQAAARIHQVFRVQSFHKKQLTKYGNDKFGMSDEQALSLIAVKTHRPGQYDEPVHAAAIRIQNKFRGWKGRKEFLITRQRIVKIQAHVRGHQVRKHYGKIIWSVGILEKVILRWRRKGSGLRGFRSEQLAEGPSTLGIHSKEDDYDFLKEGRKQTEQRLQKALGRVKSMVQYPEARDQYRRLLTVVTEFQDTKSGRERVLNSSEEAADIDADLIDLEALLDDDTFMSTVG